MKSTGKTKKKTLYGRYDDYDLPGDEALDSDESAPSHGRPGAHAQKLTDLCGADTMAPKTRPASGKRPLSGTHQAPRTSRTTPQPSAPRRRAPQGKPAEPDLTMTADFAVTRIRSGEDGNLLFVTVEGSTDEGNRVRRDVPITAEQYTALSVKVGALTKEQVDALLEAGSLCLAIRKGMELLGYGDLSARRMVFKLTSRGIAPETAQEAAAWLVAHGLIREDDAALRRAMQGARKLWGPRRIMQDLRAQGYSAEAASAALDALTGADCDPGEELPPDCVDFEVTCAALIRKKYGAVPEDRAERQKMAASLMRLGYDSDTIREAALSVMNDEAE